MKKFHLIVAILVCHCSFAQNWSYLQGGRPFSLYRFYNDTVSHKLLAVGGFDSVGTIAAQGIASWDGSIWASMGISTFPIDPTIISVTRFNGDLLLGGYYPSWNQNCPYITHWNGSTLDSLACINSGYLNGLALYQNDLIAYGAIDTIANIPVNKIALWDGVNWTDLGHGDFAVDIVDAIEYKNGLWVCGTPVSDPNHQYVMRYANNSWQTIGQAFTGGVYHLCVYNGELYAGGTNYNSSNPNAIVKLDTLNNTWHTIGGGVSSTSIASFSQIDGMCTNNGELYVIGVFDHAGGVPASYVAKWNGTQWCGLGVGYSAQLIDCEFYNDSLYLSTGMLFDNDTSNGLVEWIGGSYTDTCGFLSTGLNEQIQQGFSVTVFPNPATTNATFKMENLDGGKTLIIYDQLGKEIWRKETTENEIEFLTEGFSAGLYFYCIEQEDGKITAGKIVIEK